MLRGRQHQTPVYCGRQRPYHRLHFPGSLGPLCGSTDFADAARFHPRASCAPQYLGHRFCGAEDFSHFQEGRDSPFRLPGCIPEHRSHIHAGGVVCSWITHGVR
eukprot:8594660-Pyramimonas_sp.AAC.1